MASARVTAVVLGLCLSGLVPEARAEGGHRSGPFAIAALSRTERAALAAREQVSRPMRFGRGGAYVGGVSYQVVRADADLVLAALASAESLPHALPSTLEATMVSREGRTARIELVQGKAPFLVRYTLLLEQTESGNAIRFWLDPSRPHDIEDVWGFFRVEPFGRGKSLVTVAAAVDLGSGLSRALFEDRVQRTILRAPARIRSFVEPQALASAR